MYKSLDFNKQFHDQDKIVKGVDSIHKKSNICLSNFSKQLPRNELGRISNNTSTRCDDDDKYRPIFLDILPKNTKLSKIFETKNKKLGDVDKYLF